MSVSEQKTSNEVKTAAWAPLVFISHDSRDEELAAAFSKLLKSVSAGLLKSFRSSDKKGTEGIEYGDEWYKMLMSNLESASDVVCLFTERSLDRPWILYEAGVAKGRLNTPVHGVALGIPLKRVSTGPFYQFQNCGDSEDELTKLVLQLARRIPDLEPDSDVVRTQVNAFKTTVKEIMANLPISTDEDKDSALDDTSVAKLFEEVKVMFRDLPSRIDDRLADGMDPSRRRKLRRFDPRIFERMMFTMEKNADPIGILVTASLVRDDLPWLYEIAVEAYRTIKSGTQKDAQQLMETLDNAIELVMRDPFMEEMFATSKEMHVMMREFPRMLREMIKRSIEAKRHVAPRESNRPAA